MTNTAESVEAVTTTSCAIDPRDFSKSTTDVLRDRWTPGKMRHVAAALDGQPVAIVADRMTGHTLVNVRLGKVVGFRGGRGHGVELLSTFSDGSPDRYPVRDLRDLGTIIPLGDALRDAKWTALQTYREEGSAAIRHARADHPELGYGKWEATPGFASVSVTYEPQGGEREAHRSGARWHGSYSVNDLAQEAAA